MFKIIKMNTSKITVIAGHVLFWLFNYWFMTMGSEFNWNGFTTTSGSFGYAYTYGLFFNAVVFYAQVFWLFPIAHRNKKRLNFYVLSSTVMLLITAVETYFDTVLQGSYNVQNEPLLGSISSNFIVHIIYTIAGFYYSLTFELRKTKKANQKLLEESYKTELKYLKAQLNPHFLFNGINSVYHLIGKNNDLAKETLLQFSGLLRYQLYETSAHILLEKELDYVLKYIKVEATRRGSDMVLNYEVTSENPTLKIAPLLLIPFIENAFKHCSSHVDNTANTITIHIREEEEKLTLNVVNSYDEIPYKNAVSGIGLNNVQKRLSLLYPEKHQLHINKEKAMHRVQLSIRL